MLQEIGLKHNTDKSYLHHFCDFYEKNLNKDVKELWEIGILDGASLRMWNEYYPDAKIVGFDIEDKSHLQFDKNVEVKHLDQGNLEQLKELAKHKDVDIIVDDGSHLIPHQIMTFEILFDSLKSGGQYVIEDLHTSTNVHRGYQFENGKGTLQYLLDIIENKIPAGYPMQVRTKDVMNSISSIQILSNIDTQNVRSITSIITKK